MLKIEYNAKNGEFHVEQQGTGLMIIGEFVSMVHQYYVNVKNKHPQLAEKLKEKFEYCMKEGIIFCDTEEAVKKMNDDVDIVGLLDKLTNSLKELLKEEEKKTEKKSKTKSKTKKD